MPPKGKPKEDCTLKVASPDNGGRTVKGSDNLTLVEHRQFLYVRIVGANYGLPVNNMTVTCVPFVELKNGNYKGITRCFEQTSNPEWNEVYAFTRDRLRGGRSEILVRDKESAINEIIGCLSFDLGDNPTRFPPDSPLAERWYKLEDRNGVKVAGELMLATWIGNQADDAFSVAWHSDAAAVSGKSVTNIRSNVYLSPVLWYLRIQVIAAKDLAPADKNRKPEANIKAVLGNLVWRKPFDDHLSVEDKMGANKEGEEKTEVKFSSRLHLRIFLDGLYHVFDEPTYYSSDLRATSPKLRPEKIGVSELVVTIGVFDNCHLQAGDKNDGASDPRLGKVKIRLSTLQTGRIYTHSYPILVLQPNGLKKMGELHLAVKFSCNNWINLLGRADPPLRREVVEYMLDTGENRWSLRRAKANYQFSNHIPDILIVRRHGYVPKTNIDCILSSSFRAWSLVLSIETDVIDEEFDSFPSSKQGEGLKTRYDRLRGISGRLMIIIGDLATQLERNIHALLSWRDPRATAMDSYAMRPPRLRVGIPSIPQNFLRRLPAKTDSMLHFHLTLFSLRISLADKYYFWSLRSTPIKITGKQQLQKPESRT
ncbi:hypothetical protein POTOM_040684 [Populus tomentosa]|uniref:C2 domain-containing protein n=1 Tax=Populus tomentosa TaxID=118781 RepID=A0A8X7YKG8_POPTO|nr:hypothetical protein POTOM_040684 [Populus tomentosa]